MTFSDNVVGYWAVNGDENTNYFHASLKKRLMKQSIKGLSWHGCWITEPTDIKSATFSYFDDRFKEPGNSRPKLRSRLFKKLDMEDVGFLESSFTADKIKQAVWNCTCSKSPCPDGFNFNFIKRYWDLLKFDFVDCIKYFETSCRLAKGLNPSFLTLIPKKSDILELSDFRPISLIRCVYKVLSKLLTSRLAKVINKIIGPNQTTVIAGRQILDGSLIANEIINYASESGLKLLLFKVDFEKSFRLSKLGVFY